jgi:multiple sugar transport system permease protein
MSVQTTEYVASEIRSPASFVASRVFIYGALAFWAFICLFPIYWTVTTSFKTAVDVTQGHLIPFVDFQPDWKGWRSLGLSPDSIYQTSTVREEFLKRFMNSVITSVGASSLAIVIGSLAAYGLTRYRYHFAWFKNEDISFFFLSQLILPPVVLALPFLVLYREVGLLDTRIGLILLYTLMVLPIVIWKQRSSTGCRSGAPSSASSCRSRCRAWSPPSSWRWCCAGTSISSPPF